MTYSLAEQVVESTVPSLHTEFFALPFGNVVVELGEDWTSSSVNNLHLRIISAPSSGTPAVLASWTNAYNKSSYQQVWAAPVDSTHFLICYDFQETSPHGDLRVRLCSWDGSSLTVGPELQIFLGSDSTTASYGVWAVPLSSDRIFFGHKQAQAGATSQAEFFASVLTWNPTTLALTLSTGPTLWHGPDNAAVWGPQYTINLCPANASMLVFGDYVLSSYGLIQADNHTIDGVAVLFHIDPTTSAITVTTQGFATPNWEQMQPIDSTHFLGLSVLETNPPSWNLWFLQWQVYSFDGSSLTSLTALGTLLTHGQVDGYLIADYPMTRFADGHFITPWVQLWNTAADGSLAHLYYAVIAMDGSYNLTLADNQDMTGAFKDASGAAAVVDWGADAFALFSDQRLLIHDSFDNAAFTSQTPNEWWYSVGSEPDLEPAAMMAAARPGAHLQAHVTDFGGS